MTNTILKRTTMILSVFVLIVVTMIYNLVTTHYSVAADEETPVMVVRNDIAYAPKVGVVTKEDAAKNKAKAARKAKKAEKVAKRTNETEGTEIEIEVEATSELGEYNVAEFGEEAQQETLGNYGGDENLAPYDGGERFNANVNNTWHSGADFQFTGGSGYDDESGYSFTFYSEKVLPGDGLDIPGRHVGDEGYVCDGDGNIAIASDDLPKGTVVDVPFGSGVGVVYDSGSGYGNLDVYTSW